MPAATFEHLSELSVAQGAGSRSRLHTRWLRGLCDRGERARGACRVAPPPLGPPTEAEGAAVAATRGRAWDRASRPARRVAGRYTGPL